MAGWFCFVNIKNRNLWNYIVNLFLQMEDRNKKNRYGYQEGIISIIANLVLFGVKYWAGIVTGSLALMADAWHTLSDSASSVIVVGSVKLASRKPDDRHPFGHGRYQQIASIFIAFLLGIIAY
jgi:cation diffusion facilitator family transporter